MEGESKNPSIEIIQDDSSTPHNICKCFSKVDSECDETNIISKRKEFIFNTVSRTENYLKERRIPELIRFLFAKILAVTPSNPVAFLENLLDHCMLFRAGHGQAPVIFEDRHLEAVVKSFDPGERGWLSSGQIRRLYATLGIDVKDFIIEERVFVQALLKDLKNIQENALLELLSAGTNKNDHMA